MDVLHLAQQWFTDNCPGNSCYSDVVAAAVLKHGLDQLAGAADYHGDRALDLCQSEIEKKLYVAVNLRLWFYEATGSPSGGSAAVPANSPGRQTDLDTPIVMGDPVRQVIIFEPQHQVGKYRLDFAMRTWIRDHTGVHASQKIAIECDGHDFHERTKEQAQHDKARDRQLQAEGYAVLRFTGSEIFRNAYGCAEQIIDFMEESANREYLGRSAAWQARAQQEKILEAEKRLYGGSIA